LSKLSFEADNEDDDDIKKLIDVDIVDFSNSGVCRLSDMFATIAIDFNVLIFSASSF